MAAALSLGAAGALVGTRFQASAEALVEPEVAKAIVEGQGQDTERSRIHDIARGTPWPERYSARTIRNALLERWRGREQELEANDQAKAEFQIGAANGDLSVVPVWASEAIDLITSVASATDIVAQLSREAEAALIHAGQAVTITTMRTRQ